MRRLSGLSVFLLVLFAAESAVFFVLPSLHIPIYLSPDETAAARASRSFGEGLTMRIPDPILREYPWIHPRSLVSQGDAMVPVGFLGLPILMGIVWSLFHEWGIVLLTPLLAMSAAYPLWRFSRTFGVIGQVATVTTWLSFPTVILYANRGAFPNLPVVCLMLWATLLIWEHRSWMRSACAGVVFGLAMSIRPVEVIWAIPWMIAAWQMRPGAKKEKELWDMILFLSAAVFVLGCASLVAWMTYRDPFVIGYALRDPVMGDASVMGPASTVTVGWPFGFHPRNVLFNARVYFAGYLGPWALCTIVAAVIWIKRGMRAVPLLAGWTFVALCAMYAGTIYQDHVGLNVASLGNSFLRYTLPLAPFIAISVGSLAAWLEHCISREHARTLALLATALLFLCGTWTAVKRDDEGIEADAKQIQSYATILSLAEEKLPAETIILSERSDKIFFPRFRVASPVPDESSIQHLVHDGRYPVAFFGLTADTRSEQRVYTVGNMAMVLIRDASSTRP